MHFCGGPGKGCLSYPARQSRDKSVESGIVPGLASFGDKAVDEELKKHVKGVITSRKDAEFMQEFWHAFSTPAGCGGFKRSAHPAVPDMED